jgi:hypothetical protein
MVAASRVCQFFLPLHLSLSLSFFSSHLPQPAMPSDGSVNPVPSNKKKYRLLQSFRDKVLGQNPAQTRCSRHAAFSQPLFEQSYSHHGISTPFFPSMDRIEFLWDRLTIAITLVFDQTTIRPMPPLHHPLVRQKFLVSWLSQALIRIQHSLRAR